MRMARRSLVLLAPFLTVFAAACTLTHDLEDLTRGEDDSGAPGRGSDDGGAGGGDDANVTGSEPGSNAQSSDGGTLGDARDDGAAAIEVNDVPKFVDAGTFCDGGTTFCADFDRTPLPSGFAGTEGTYLALTSSRASSAPNDLLLLVPAMSSNGVFASKVSQDFQATVNGAASLQFDIFPQRTTDDGALLVAALDFLSGTKYSIRFAYFGGQLRIEESFLGAGPIDRYHASFDVPKMTWSRVRVDLTFGSDGGVATEGVTVNGSAVGGKETLAPPAGVILRPTFHLGAVYGVGPQSGWELRFDNVALDLH